MVPIEKKLIGYVTGSISVDEFTFAVYPEKVFNISRHAYVISYPSDETRIGVLSRIVKGGSCSVDAADKLAKYFNLELVEKKRKGKHKS